MLIYNENVSVSFSPPPKRPYETVNIKKNKKKNSFFNNAAAAGFRRGTLGVQEHIFNQIN